MSFPLFTSIKPPSSDSELSYLRDCLNSWRVAGFDPVSASGPSEIEVLRPLDLPVKFAPLPEDGKPRIGAILQAIRESGVDVAGIINSDCQIIGNPRIAENLKAGLSGRLAVAWRTDIGDREPTPDRWGFDAFFLDTRALPDDDLGFRIGDPWWDNWFPFACERMGAEVEPLPPVLAHRAHPANWSSQQWEENGRRVWRWFGKPGNPTAGDLGVWMCEFVPRVRGLPQTICITGGPETEAMLRFSGRAMLAKYETEQLRAELAAMRASMRRLSEQVAMGAYLEAQEEVFRSLCAAAQLKEQLGRSEQEVIDAYLEAAGALPPRAEALHGASRFCRTKGRHEEGFQLARQGLAIGRPSNGISIEPWIYDWGLLDELAVNGGWSGHYVESLDACVKLLASAACPPDQRGRIAGNARFALEKLPHHPDSFLSGVSGIIHVGANYGQERETYASHDLSVLWVEALPDVCALLRQNLNNFTKQKAVQALVTDQVGQKYTFHVSNNSGASSSIYEFALHREIWPDVQFTHDIELVSTTLDQIVLEKKIDLSRVDALVMDTQGSELLVLKGADRVLRHLRYIKTKAADFGSYLGSTTVAELAAFLSDRHFRIVAQKPFAEHPAGGRYYELLFQRDAEMLERALELEQDPLIRSRYLFFLAQSYRDAGQLDKADPSQFEKISAQIITLSAELNSAGDVPGADALVEVAANVELLSTDLQNCWGGPFNGQAGREAIVRDLIAKLRFEAVVETGTYRGISTEWFARHFPGPTSSCENCRLYYLQAEHRLAGYPNVKLELADSRDFLRAEVARLPTTARVLFYLDAHWQNTLPLADELRIILSSDLDAVIMIDDFKVPCDEGYAFDDYGPGQALTLEMLGFLRDSDIRVFFPRLPSSEETGARRGLCVLASRLAGEVAACTLLREADWRDWDMPETTAGTIVFPIISRSPTLPDGVLPSAVEKAFDTALGDIEQPAPAFLDLEGMSGRRYRIFINTLIRIIPDPRYLEVGVWKGSTLCSAIAGNTVQAVAVDNWSDYGGPREHFIENLARFKAASEIIVIDEDFRAVRYADYGCFNVYLYDGSHSVADQYDGLALALPALDPEFVFIVDDWNWADVREGTHSAIQHLDLEIISAIEVRTTLDGTHPPYCGFEAKATDWHNGYFIAVLRKPTKSTTIGSSATATRSDMQSIMRNVTRSPVLFLVFNRPDTTALVMQAIRKAQTPRLYIAADGPRDLPGESDACAEVRRIATAVDWDCEVRTLFHNRNFGCREAVSTAITWFFNNEEAGIILEDDCLPSSAFFRYCDELLERYRWDSRIMAICGSSYADPDPSYTSSYYFSYYADMWGWATWRRAWQFYDKDLARWSGAGGHQVLDTVAAGREWHKAYWAKYFDWTARGLINAWGYQWIYTVIEQGGLACYPVSNLISNLGHRSDATHTTHPSPAANLPHRPLAFPLVHPAHVERSPALDQAIEARRLDLLPPPSLEMPNLSGSLAVARLRYIQSVHEPPGLRNPDTLVKYFIPIDSASDQAQLGAERRAPFYYYLVARTKYYDEVFLNAACCGVQQIIIVGSGTDTRAYRFAEVLKREGVSVIECDQREAISAKQRLAEKLGRFDHVEYLPLDLHEDGCLEFECRLAEARAKSLVLMEGVSPYVHESAFSRFLLLLANKLPAESRIAYDFKISGVNDDLFSAKDDVGRILRTFRLPKASEDVAAFHAQHGYRLEHMELSSEVSTRLLPNLVDLGATLFSEDGLVQLITGT